MKQRKAEDADRIVHWRGDATGGLAWYSACGLWFGRIAERNRPLVLNRKNVTCARCKKLRPRSLPMKRWKVVAQQRTTRTTIVMARTPAEARELAGKKNELDWVIENISPIDYKNAEAYERNRGL